MEPKTHLQIDRSLCGAPLELEPGRARVELTTTPVMQADAQGLVHGGFMFGLADYAAMLAVNDPYVVLGSSEARFLAPVRVGQTVVAEARVLEVKGKKQTVEVTVCRDETQVLFATLTCFVLPQHVLDA